MNLYFRFLRYARNYWGLALMRSKCFEKGRIFGTGTHPQLLALGGISSQLYSAHYAGQD